MAEQLFCPNCRTVITDEILDEIEVEVSACYQISTTCPDCEKRIWIDVNIDIGVQAMGAKDAAEMDARDAADLRSNNGGTNQ